MVDSPPQEINLISCEPMAHISDIKLIRTDTTLDLSQKAEKGMLCSSSDFPFYTSVLFILPLSYTMWDSAFETSKSGSTAVYLTSLRYFVAIIG